LLIRGKVTSIHEGNSLSHTLESESLFLIPPRCVVSSFSYCRVSWNLRYPLMRPLLVPVPAFLGNQAKTVLPSSPPSFCCCAFPRRAIHLRYSCGPRFRSLTLPAAPPVGPMLAVLNTFSIWSFPSTFMEPLSQRRYDTPFLHPSKPPVLFARSPHLPSLLQFGRPTRSSLP